MFRCQGSVRVWQRPERHQRLRDVAVGDVERSVCRFHCVGLRPVHLHDVAFVVVLRHRQAADGVARVVKVPGPT